MGLVLWVRSLQARIERILGEKPGLMVTYIAAENADDWGLTVRFPKGSKWRYLHKEIHRPDLLELMDEGNRFADSFAEFEKRETELYEEIPF